MTESDCLNYFLSFLALQTACAAVGALVCCRECEGFTDVSFRVSDLEMLVRNFYS